MFLILTAVYAQETIFFTKTNNDNETNKTRMSTKQQQYLVKVQTFHQSVVNIADDNRK